MTEVCQYLHDSLSRARRFRLADLGRVYLNGVYVLFEHGEYAHGGERIVRVGTHRGQNKLPGRIREHLYTPNKDRSIFRKHVGRCILAKDPFLDQWEIDLTSRNARELYADKIDRRQLQETEAEVTRYMNENFSFTALKIGEQFERATVETRLLSTLYHCCDCRVSEKWLGKSHPKSSIISKGKLWNVQGLTGPRLTLGEARRIIELYGCNAGISRNPQQ
jgi:hypothetical protein